MASKAPERACILLVKIDADDRRSVIAQLHHIAHQLERGDIGSPWISGGYSSGHILSYTESGSPTHDEYFAQLDAHLKAIDAEKQPAPETPADDGPDPERVCSGYEAPAEACMAKVRQHFDERRANPPPVTTYKHGANGCEHCGLSFLLHIEQDEFGRKDVCQGQSSANRGESL